MGVGPQEVLRHRHGRAGCQGVSIGCGRHRDWRQDGGERGQQGREERAEGTEVRRRADEWGASEAGMGDTIGGTGHLASRLRTWPSCGGPFVGEDGV